MRIVIDTNAMVSGIFWPGPPSQILELWAQRKIHLLVSEEILSEYIRVIEELSLERGEPELANKWTAFIVQNAIITQAPSICLDCTDLDDNKFVDCAVAGKCDYVISGDKALLKLNPFLGIPIIKPSAFLKIILK